MSKARKQSTEAAVREIRRKTRKKFAPEQMIRVVLEGLRGEQRISELCRRESIASNLYYRLRKDFLEAGKKQFAGDTVREATSHEVQELRAENREVSEPPAFLGNDRQRAGCTSMPMYRSIGASHRRHGLMMLMPAG